MTLWKGLFDALTMLHSIVHCWLAPNSSNTFHILRSIRVQYPQYSILRILQNGSLGCCRPLLWVPLLPGHHEFNRHEALWCMVIDLSLKLYLRSTIPGVPCLSTSKSVVEKAAYSLGSMTWYFWSLITYKCYLMFSVTYSLHVGVLTFPSGSFWFILQACPASGPSGPRKAGAASGSGTIMNKHFWINNYTPWWSFLHGKGLRWGQCTTCIHLITALGDLNGV